LQAKKTLSSRLDDLVVEVESLRAEVGAAKEDKHHFRSQLKELECEVVKYKADYHAACELAEDAKLEVSEMRFIPEGRDLLLKLYDGVRTGAHGMAGVIRGWSEDWSTRYGWGYKGME